MQNSYDADLSLFIGGSWRIGEGRDLFPVVDPASGQAIGAVPLASAADLDEALDAADTGFKVWRTTPADQRGTVLKKAAALLRERAEPIARLLTLEQGKPLAEARAEVLSSAVYIEWCAEEAVRIYGRTLVRPTGQRALITRQPIGPVAAFSPWNFPVYQPVRVLASNLMAGNGVILKHATICTGSGLMLRDVCLEAGLPKGLFDVVLVDHDVSDAIIGYERVRGVTLTGSDTAGRHIGETAAKHLKKSVLELGSNDAYLVLEDADVALAVKTCVMGRIYNNGETCVSAKRFIVTAAVYNAFIGAFVEQMQAITMGDPTADATQLGPLSSKEQFDTLAEQVSKSIAGGATLLCGGVPAESDGYYFPATVLADCQPGTPAYDDELFGPVASVIMARDDRDAMRIANDSRYGLGGGIFSKNTDEAFRLARDEFDTGMVRINVFGTADPNMPFGGVKDSGFGREHGGFGMKQFINAKAIYMP